MQKDAVASIAEELRKLKNMMDNLKYEMNAVNEGLSNTKKDVESNFKETTEHIDDLRNRIISLEALCNNLRKQLEAMRRDKMMNSNAAINSQIGSDTQVSAELEEEFAKLKSDFEAHKVDSQKRFKQIDLALDDKVSKRDFEMLEQQLMERLQELLANLGNQFADKELVRKKLVAIEKNVSFYFMLSSTSSKTSTTW